MIGSTRWYDAEQLRWISEVTIAHYDRLAEAYWDGTRDHDVNQNYAALLDAIEGDPPYSILDLGCGPGRDPTLLPIIGPRRRGPGRIDGIRGHGTLLFGVRGPPTGLPRDGITAEPLRWHLCECIAVPRAEPGAAEGFGGTLQNFTVPGCAFCSNPRGNNEEGLSSDRYSCFFDHDIWRDY